MQLYQLSPQAAQQSQALAKKLIATAKQQGRQTVKINQLELNGLTALAHRAFPNTFADVSLSQYGAFAEVSIALPLPSIIKYLNMSAYVLPSPNGLLIDEVNIGHFTVSGETFFGLASFFADKFLKENLVEQALAMIRQVEISPESLTATVAIDKDMLTQGNDDSLLLNLRDNLALFGDVNLIKTYYNALAEFANDQKSGGSIADYLAHMFKLAYVRSANRSEQYITENQAAVMALVIYFGADRFELMVGDVINREHSQLVIRNRLRSQTRLQGRVDLQKHFVYSMALQMFSNAGASDAIGEFKEFLDSSSPKGSGFSFADLMADRAGTRLAMIVTSNEERALRAQSLLMNVTDENLLPSIEGLDEGIDESSFIEQYSDIHSKQYKNTLNSIDQRLKQLPVYQLGWQ